MNVIEIYRGEEDEIFINGKKAFLFDYDSPVSKPDVRLQYRATEPDNGRLHSVSEGHRIRTEKNLKNL